MFIIKSETTLEIMIHDQLKYDIIYPALFLFQMQYKLKIRSLALLGSTYTTFNLANCYGSGLGLLEAEYSPKGRPRYCSQAL
jgi:hypothetical protein